LGEGSPYLGEVSPYWGGVVPYLGGVSPQIGGGFPYLGGEPPYCGGVSPYSGGVSPYLGEVFPRAFQTPRPIRSRFRNAVIRRASWTASPRGVGFIDAWRRWLQPQLEARVGRLPW
jgi:hypothetical protein